MALLSADPHFTFYCTKKRTKDFNLPDMVEQYLTLRNSSIEPAILAGSEHLCWQIEAGGFQAGREPRTNTK